MTPEKLRKLYGDASPKAAAKTITVFDDHCKKFIEHATFLVLASSDGTSLDVSPKGDPAGFVEVESETTLLLPDRPGNNRLDAVWRKYWTILLFAIVLKSKIGHRKPY